MQPIAGSIVNESYYDQHLGEVYSFKGYALYKFGEKYFLEIGYPAKIDRYVVEQGYTTFNEISKEEAEKVLENIGSRNCAQLNVKNPIMWN